MPAIFAAHVTTGAQLRQFVLALLRAQGLHEPGSFAKFPLDDYLGSLWQAAQPYRDRPFRYYFIAELLALAFDTPPMPYDWEAQLQQPYRPVPDHLAPTNTAEYRAELKTFDYFERLIKRQIVDLKRIRLQPPVVGWEHVTIDGKRVYWENTSVESFLERGTSLLEDSVELEENATWDEFSSILKEGQYTE